MLTVVRPPSAGQASRPPRGRRRAAPAFTVAEEMRLRAALRNLRALYGTWECLAEVMGLHAATLKAAASGRKRPTPTIALAAARAAGKTIDDITSPPSAADRCKHCGRGA